MEGGMAVEEGWREGGGGGGGEEEEEEEGAHLVLKNHTWHGVRSVIVIATIP